MPRKAAPPKAVGPDWYLPEWMETLHVRQADIVAATEWPKSRVSEIVSGKTSYYREIVNELSRVLNIQPYELLMHPEQANAIKRQRADALRIAAEERQEWRGFEPERPDDDGRLRPKRAGG